MRTITLGQWQATRDALRRTGDRFLALVASAPDPQAMATKDWTVADTVAHVRSIASLYTSILQPDEVPHPFPDVEHRIQTTTVDTVAEINDIVLDQFPERDTRVLNDLLDGDIRQILDSTEHADPATPIPWLGGSRVPVAGVLAHLVNELLSHGWDIARALKSPWELPPADAALFFELFLIGMIRQDAGGLLGPQLPGRRIAVEFHSAHTTPVTMVLKDRRVTLEETGLGADARITFDPPTLNLMLFGRVSKARAALTGKVRVSGPRLWRLPEFLRIVHLPENSYPRTGTPR
ncbi:maleylpyruvate isomerase N-terminal domain-containing protein [Acrocarpospora phusangensis]|uniref:maleylpyruvate isomerase N-terminal domain-containing protein n=1 Tax=Acrocarpospora phusangensis TaxID=1070424 RepID=UPI001EF21463|nr:maleylpyruvate isomerase N-terminal domain-containing protein [Acrocarpospora phusangensis]